MIYQGLGLTITQFLEFLQDQDLRKFVDPGILPILDAVFDGYLDGKDLQNVVRTLVDFDLLLREPQSRRFILNLVPEQKRIELENRVGRNIYATGTDEYTETEVQRIRDFFGLVEERIVPPPMPPTDTIAPLYGLFDHQRDVVRKLIPLLAEDERRAILHLPTGVGKTRTAMHVVVHSLRTYEPSVVVWLASGKRTS